MATGRRPFPEAQAPQLIAAIMNESPQLPSGLNSQISAGLESIILKALEKDPEQRYQSSQELNTDLERLGGPESRCWQLADGARLADNCWLPQPLRWWPCWQ